MIGILVLFISYLLFWFFFLPESSHLIFICASQLRNVSENKKLWVLNQTYLDHFCIGGQS